MASLFVLAISKSLLHFYIVSILQSLFFGINATVGNALVIDLVAKESLGRGLSLFSATNWIGGVLGFAITGYALKSLGELPTFVIGICLALLAIIILIPIQSEVKRRGTIVVPKNNTV